MAHTKYTAGSQLPVWRGPRNEPLVDVDCAVLVTIHHQVTVLILAVIRPFPQGHVLFVLALMAQLGRITFAYYREFFPVMQTLVPTDVLI